ncbi:hypothetical protein [Actinoplanes sp. L3-i22]|uniref:hypothetical protein n=1 Tax=Actinoplanes sp. L3-i22 TaxID=2836373 RepID=UPI001C76F2FB|nr:hypothetical protein [Actinoplanes sp. L3-i22]BCY11163.1 hypothetical protein L3i22_062510 [Actinoplanes sp. L3-i22]
MTIDEDTALAQLLHQHVLDVLGRLAETGEPDTDPDAVAAFRDAVLPPAPVTLPVAAGLFVDLNWWLDACDDDELDPDYAVKLLEESATLVQGLPEARLERLLATVATLAAGETHPARRYQFRFVPYAFGLLDDEPDLDEPDSLAWTPPADRAPIR